MDPLIILGVLAVIAYTAVATVQQGTVAVTTIFGRKFGSHVSSKELTINALSKKVYETRTEIAPGTS